MSTVLYELNTLCIERHVGLRRRAMYKRNMYKVVSEAYTNTFDKTNWTSLLHVINIYNGNNMFDGDAVDATESVLRVITTERACGEFNKVDENFITNSHNALNLYEHFWRCP